MTTQIVGNLESFSEAELESLEFVPEELENIESVLYPNLDSISLEEVAKDLEAFFEAEGLENWSKVKNITGRIAAVAATKQYAPGTVGAVVNRAVTPFAKIFGDFASGNIGKHYQEQNTVKLLKLKATDQNLQAFARNETEWWKKQPGFAGTVGAAMSAQNRAKILICVNKNPNNPGSCPL